MESSYRLYITFVIFLLYVVYSRCSLDESIDTEDTHPSNRRSFQLYSRTGFYLTISKTGVIGATFDKDDINTHLQLESYSQKKRRIRRDSYYLSVNKHGYLRTRTKLRKDTMFIETQDVVKGSYWLNYKDKENGFILALKSRTPLKHKLKKKTKRKHKKRTEFLTLLL